jgi:hypothetical protein
MKGLRKLDRKLKIKRDKGAVMMPPPTLPNLTTMLQPQVSTSAIVPCVFGRAATADPAPWKSSSADKPMVTDSDNEIMQVCAFVIGLRRLAIFCTDCRGQSRK